MESYILRITLLSDTCFGRGDGVAGIIDREIQHDDLGYPYLGGREIKGILVDECADILSAMRPKNRDRWEVIAAKLFGTSGASLEGGGKLSIGPACIPGDLRKYLLELREQEITKKLSGINPEDYKYESRRRELEEEFRASILNCLSGIRQQTAIGEDGVQKEHSLRTTRVILRNYVFESELYLLVENEDVLPYWTLLSAVLMSFRRAGASRNRGLGKLKVQLCSDTDDSIIQKYFESFKTEVLA